MEKHKGKGRGFVSKTWERAADFCGWDWWHCILWTISLRIYFKTVVIKKWYCATRRVDKKWLAANNYSWFLHGRIYCCDFIYFRNERLRKASSDKSCFGCACSVLLCCAGITHCFQHVDHLTVGHLPLIKDVTKITRDTKMAFPRPFKVGFHKIVYTVASDEFH